jgi:hypothetical protein
MRIRIFFALFLLPPIFSLQADEQLFGFVRGTETLPANRSEIFQFVILHEGKGEGIRDQKWRAQFVGKTRKSRLKLDNDIKNISGAILSCPAHY